MATLIVAEHDNSELKPATLNAVAAAQAIGGDMTLLVAGSGCAGVAEQAAKVAGISKVLVADSAEYAPVKPIRRDNARCTLVILDGV